MPCSTRIREDDRIGHGMQSSTPDNPPPRKPPTHGHRPTSNPRTTGGANRVRHPRRRARQAPRPPPSKDHAEGPAAHRPATGGPPRAQGLIQHHRLLHHQGGTFPLVDDAFPCSASPAGGTNLRTRYRHRPVRGSCAGRRTNPEFAQQLRTPRMVAERGFGQYSPAHPPAGTGARGPSATPDRSRSPLCQARHDSDSPWLRPRRPRPQRLNG
jgi:hypothetical protein